jgi:hypothetical protein
VKSSSLSCSNWPERTFTKASGVQGAWAGCLIQVFADPRVFEAAMTALRECGYL